MGLIILGFIALWTSPNGPLAEYLALRTTTWAAKPWTLITYPFIYAQAFFFFLLLLLWFFSLGGQVEMELTTKRYLTFWAVISLVCGLIFVLALKVVGQNAQLDGPLLPLSCVTVAWATRNRTTPVQFMMLIPLMGQWLGWISAGIVLFDLGRIHPGVGAMCLIPLGLTYLFADDKIPGIPWRARAKVQPGHRGKFYSESYYDDVKKREQEREEKERLRKLFENSFKDDKS